MSLKFSVDTLDGLPADIAGFYTKNADGKFYLDVEGAVSKTKVDEFRATNVELLRKLEGFKDVDPVKYAELQKLGKLAEEKKLVEAGDVEKLVGLRVGEMRTTLQTEIDTLKNVNMVANRQLEALLIDSSVRDAAIKSGVQPSAVEDVLLRAKTVFQIKDGAAVPLDSNGQVVYGKDGATPMSVVDWAAGLKKQAPHLFQPSNGSGANTANAAIGAHGAKLSSVDKIGQGLENL